MQTTVWLAFGCALVGALLWSPAEYLLHRFAMHSRRRLGPIESEHRQHHREPEATSLALRALLHLMVFAAVGGLGLLLSAAIPREAALGLAMGFAAGFSSYEILHWRSHHRDPKWAYTVWLRAHHLDHHRHARRSYGVTSGLWDRVFGTAS